jgi:hypothetical protein
MVLEKNVKNKMDIITNDEVIERAKVRLLSKI